jgi:hypothetical protein
MNSKTWSRVMVLTLFAALAVPVPIGAQGKQNHHSMHHHYQFVDIGTSAGRTARMRGQVSATGP